MNEHAPQTQNVHTPTMDDRGRLLIRGHADVVTTAHDPERFSSATSRFLQIPNGLDGEEHAEFRHLLDPFLHPDALQWLVPRAEEIAERLVTGFGSDRFDAVHDLGSRYAVRTQSAWLGWRPEVEDELIAWVEENRAATRSGELERTAAAAEWFDRIIAERIAHHRANPSDDLTCQLINLRREDGSPLDDAYLTSILRNWTGGDLASLALCIGVISHFLATHPEVQDDLRTATDDDVDAAIDEMLRLDDPFPSNRRVATEDTEVAGCPVAHGSHVLLDWRSANTDPAVFTPPEAYRPHENRDHNLVYGTGPHVCPGRGLATLELRIVTRVLLWHGTLELAGKAERETAPAAGFRSVPVRLV